MCPHLPIASRHHHSLKPLSSVNAGTAIAGASTPFPLYSHGYSCGYAITMMVVFESCHVVTWAFRSTCFKIAGVRGYCNFKEFAKRVIKATALLTTITVASNLGQTSSSYIMPLGRVTIVSRYKLCNNGPILRFTHYHPGIFQGLPNLFVGFGLPRIDTTGPNPTLKNKSTQDHRYLHR